MKNRENTIIVKKIWGETNSDAYRQKIKEHFEKFGKCQIYFGWVYTGEEGAEIEFETKEIQQKALADVNELGYDYEAAPEPPSKEKIDEMKKEMNVAEKKYKAAMFASKNAGK